ncbi:inositol monophosphatase [Parasphingopyxis algicola]|uniref:inositol monophosphatase family protein n=1 Tax=Parasphingopyxis algicola TaxID=2026624 RepID=UPI00159FBC2C|nr:inositol monophosphatase family protein [Parasphingopyxis algicola]QLC24251.1 inositol monophosphatase [Parasphingopyxis algicola]
MSAHRFHAPVSALLRETAETIVMPRFQALAAHEIAEKSPGDIVTVADHESEERLSAALAAICPEARIVGEEAAVENPAMLDELGEGMVWLVDPLDGTTNFSEGVTPFAIMVALLVDGETEAGWIYDPVARRMCHAHRGNGAFVDGRSIRARPTGEPRPIAALGVHFLSEDERAGLERRAGGKLRIVAIPRCAGEQYPRLALGENDMTLFARSWPYDHAPGALLLAEAGGKTAWPDGTLYTPTKRRPGLLSAATPQLWDQAAEILFG